MGFILGVIAGATCNLISIYYEINVTPIALGAAVGAGTMLILCIYSNKA